MTPSSPSGSIALFDRWPRLGDALSWIPLGEYPTPVHRLKPPVGSGFKEPRGGLWVKRDDFTGTLYGGNKVRKLEFIFGDARRGGHKSVWTTGAIGSHHALATALYGRQLGFDVHILHFPQPVTGHVLRNLLAVASTGARLELATSQNTLPIHMARATVKQWLAGSGGAYHIPVGGSSAVGVLGYVNAALELAGQIEAGELPEPERIYVAAGTCGTFAGLWLGCRLAGLKTEVIGIRVVDLIFGNPVVASRLINQAAALLHEAEPQIPQVVASPRELTIRHTYLGEAYGVPTRRGEHALEVFEEMGLGLDPTYTGKTAGALLDELTRANLKPGGAVVYWNTLSSASLEPLLQKVEPSDLPKEYQLFFASHSTQGGAS